MSVTNPAIRRKLPSTEVTVPNGEEMATHEQHPVQAMAPEPETEAPHDYTDIEATEEDQLAELKQLRRALQDNLRIISDMMVEYLPINLLSKETILSFGELRGHYLVIVNSINRDISDAEQQG